MQRVLSTPPSELQHAVNELLKELTRGINNNDVLNGGGGGWEEAIAMEADGAVELCASLKLLFTRGRIVGELEYRTNYTLTEPHSLPFTHQTTL